MVRKATLGMFLMLLVLICLGFNSANAQTASPSQAVITVSGVPTGTTGLAVEVTVDTGVITLSSSASSSVSGGLVVTDSASMGVGIIGTSGDLPASFTITVPFTAVAAGTSMVSVGSVLDMLGGAAIAGATASVNASSVTVASSSSTSTSTTSSSSSTGGTGMLSADTVTITINGQGLNSTNALNLTLSFGTNGVATLDTTGVTFMGTGATQLLTAAAGNVATVTWDGAITDSQAVVTVMLKPGSTAGSTTISVSKIEAAGGTDITSSVVATVSPASVTNGGGSSTSGSPASFSLIGPTSVTGPGKAAIAISASGVKKGQLVKLNGSVVKFSADRSSGVAIVNLSKASEGKLALTVKSGKSTVNLGDLTVTTGTGASPKVAAALANNKSDGTTLKILGKDFDEADSDVTLVPAGATVTNTSTTSKKIDASASECIPNGSYVNVTTPGGTGAKKVKVHGSCN